MVYGPSEPTNESSPTCASSRPFSPVLPIYLSHRIILQTNTLAQNIIKSEIILTSLNFFMEQQGENNPKTDDYVTRYNKLVWERLNGSIRMDSRMNFRHYLRAQPSGVLSHDELLSKICLNDAVNCASDLLQLEFDTDWRVDVNAVLEGGLTPLQIAAQKLSYPMIQLFLLHGAHPNILPADHTVDVEKLPLYLALETLRKQFLSDWSPEKSIFKLLYILCLKKLSEPLAAVKLLASKTEHRYLELISKRCLEKGEIHQLGALLQVSWHALVNPSPDRRGLEACQLWQCISDELKSYKESVSHRRTELESAHKLLTVMDKARDKLEYNRGRTILDTEAHDMPFEVSRYLSFEAKIPMAPEDVFSDDVNCLMPKISAKHKAKLAKEIRGHLGSGRPSSGVKDHGTRSRSYHTSQALDNNFIVPSRLVDESHEKESTVVKKTDSIKFMPDESGIMDLEPRMNEILEHDKKDEFVNLMNNLPCDDDALQCIIGYIFDYDAVKCAEAILNREITDPDGKLNPQSFFSGLQSTPLSLAIRCDALRLTVLLLDHGEDANLRSAEGWLPLRLALHRIRRDECWVRWSHTKSAFRLLLNILGCVVKVKHLQSLRVLARHTRDIQLEIDAYLREQNLIEVGALMLLGYRPSPGLVSTLLESEGERSANQPLLQLVEVFDKIGEKLEAYAKIKRLHSARREKVVKEMYALFQEAGLPVTSRDISTQDWRIYSERLDGDGKRTPSPWHVLQHS